MPPEKQFVHDLERCIELENNNNSRKPSQTYKPSSIGGCERNIYFQLIGAEPDASKRSAMLVCIGESGTDRHIRLQQHIIAMKDFGIDCEYIDVEDFVKTRNLTDIEIISKDGIETKCYNKRYNISFLTDGIIRYNGKYYILEIKTETSRKYWEHDNTRSEHLAQGIAYYLSFGISQVMYLYENRDALNHKAYITQFDEQSLNDMIDKIKKIDEFVISNTVPPKIEDKHKCVYCTYKKECEKYV